MDHDLICSWLGLPPGTWPPDHYRLLSLKPGEGNAELIEQRVHERLDCVRRYQMMHPEQATEAMNRLAQAFVCLTDAAAKKTYDAQLGIAAPPVQARAEEAPPSPELEEPAPATESLDWLSSPPDVVGPTEKTPPAAELPEPSPRNVPASPPPLPAVVVNDGTDLPPPLRQPPPLPALMAAAGETQPPMALIVVPGAAPAPTAPPLEPIDTILEAAQSSAARRGIGTRRTLYRRIARTRQLLRVWNDLGKFLSSPKRRLSRSADGPELLRLLEEITTLLKDFPALLGEAGQPGYLVLALAQLDTVKVFQSFSAHQREALSRDWGAGFKLLTAHRDFLRQELRDMRKRPFRERLLRASWSLVVDQPGTVLLLLALLAIIVARWRTSAEAFEKLFSP
ncbi:MAG TPA: hypothetical protein VMG10_35670 [Gemmataceae bacterium]|nr:hypothetical protein [Gemmataceae bacterium]